MVRSTVTTGLLLALALAVAVTEPVSATARSGIDGVVRDTTCAGPCRIPPPPPPLYTGGGLTVRVRDLATHEVVAEAHPKNGRFHLDGGPGHYRVHAKVDDRCWQGSRKNVTLADTRAWVRLTVRNGCIV